LTETVVTYVIHFAALWDHFLLHTSMYAVTNGKTLRNDKSALKS